MLIIVVALYPANNSSAETITFEKTDSGTIIKKAATAMSSYMPSMLYNSVNARGLVCAIMLMDSGNKFNSSSSLDAAKVMSSVNYGCWLGMKSDGKLILIGYFGEKEQLIKITYSSKDPLEYAIYNIPEGYSNESLESIVVPIFREEGVSDFAEVKSEDIIEGFKKAGVDVSVSK